MTVNQEWKVLISTGRSHKDEDGQHASRHVLIGREVLDNNGVNLLMAFLSSVTGMGVASIYWGI